jgi:hypothetical protein
MEAEIFFRIKVEEKFKELEDRIAKLEAEAKTETKKSSKKIVLEAKNNDIVASEE